MGALAGSREALLLSAHGDKGQGTAAASEAGFKRVLTATVVESGRVLGTSSVVAGELPRD